MVQHGTIHCFVCFIRGQHLLLIQYVNIWPIKWIGWLHNSEEISKQAIVSVSVSISCFSFYRYACDILSSMHGAINAHTCNRVKKISEQSVAEVAVRMLENETLEVRSPSSDKYKRAALDCGKWIE